VGNKAAGSLGVLGGEGHSLANGAEGGFPRIVRAEAPGHELTLHLGQIDGAAGGAAQQLGSQLIGTWFTVKHREERGSIQHDPIHSWLPRVVRQSAR